jgi:hypothetical protein
LRSFFLLEQHRLDCDSCCERARSFSESDPLLEALRNEPTVEEDPEGELVADLMERFRLIRPTMEYPTGVLPQSKQELAFVRVSGNTLAEEYS